jgi:hypothetical protein
MNQYLPCIKTEDYRAAPDQGSSFGLLLTQTSLVRNMLGITLGLLHVIINAIDTERVLRSVAIIRLVSRGCSLGTVGTLGAGFGSLRVLLLVSRGLGIDDGAGKAPAFVAASHVVEDAHYDGYGERWADAGTG